MVEVTFYTLLRLTPMSDLLNFTLSQNSLMAIVAILVTVGVAIPSPVQPILKALQAFFSKKPVIGENLPITEQQAITRLPALVQELSTLISQSPDSRALVTSELIRLLQFSVGKADGKLPDLIIGILALLTTEHSKRPDIDLSKELSQAWAKLSGGLTVPMESIDARPKASVVSSVVK
jgi:hypothetical protein